jgi:hypothetical protein
LTSIVKASTLQHTKPVILALVTFEFKENGDLFRVSAACTQSGEMLCAWTTIGGLAMVTNPGSIDGMPKRYEKWVIFVVITKLPSEKGRFRRCQLIGTKLQVHDSPFPYFPIVST